uniref:Glutamate receptor n=1 Tax=Ciona savignyi TaxID=51511 RepID=H2ZDS0_CIOSA
DEPFVFVQRDSDGHMVFSGFSIDLLHMLSERIGFRYEVYEVADRKYGAFKDGKWNGLVGDVVSKKADFAIAAMTITPQREKVVDFTKRYMDYAVGILMKKPKAVTNLFAFLNPFDNTVWYAIMAGLFIVSILLYVLNRVSAKQMPGPPYHDMSLHGTFWFVYSSLVQQGTDMNLVTISSQIVTGVWWFFILIIISSYTANLAAHLTVTRMENHITSFRDLSKQNDFVYGTALDTSIFDFLRTKGGFFKVFFLLLKQDTNVTFSDPKEGIQRVKEENYAFLWDVAVIEYLILTDSQCSFSTVPDSIYDKGYGIAVEQGNPIREVMSMAILQLQDSGEITRLKQRWWTSVGKCPIDHTRSRSHSSSELTLENFAGVFCVLACGLVIATLVAIVELCQYMKKTKKLQKHRLVNT